MTASYASSVLDAALAKVATGTHVHACTGTPTDRAAVLASSLANVAVDSGDFTIGAGAPDGRAVTVAAQADVAVTATGTPAHYAVIDGTELLALTEVDPATPGFTVGSESSFPAVTFGIYAPEVVAG